MKTHTSHSTVARDPNPPKRNFSLGTGPALGATAQVQVPPRTLPTRVANPLPGFGTRTDVPITQKLRTCSNVTSLKYVAVILEENEAFLKPHFQIYFSNIQPQAKHSDEENLMRCAPPPAISVSSLTGDLPSEARCGGPDAQTNGTCPRPESPPHVSPSLLI